MMKSRFPILSLVLVVFSSCHRYNESHEDYRMFMQRENEPSFELIVSEEVCTDCLDVQIDSGYAIVPADLKVILHDCELSNKCHW